VASPHLRGGHRRLLASRSVVVTDCDARGSSASDRCRLAHDRSGCESGVRTDVALTADTRQHGTAATSRV